MRCHAAPSRMGRPAMPCLAHFAAHAWDSRCILPLAVLNGLLLWSMPPLEAAAAGIIFLFLFFRQAGIRKGIRFAAAWLPPVLYWGAMTAASGALTGENGALLAGAQACGRLCLLFLLGAWLANRSSAKAMAIAAEWHLRLLFPKSSWKIALALSAMLQFLPLVARKLSGYRLSVRMRLRHASAPRRLAVAACALVRAMPPMEKAAFEAIAARRLDNPAPWQDNAPLPVPDALAALCIAAAELFFFFFLR